MDIYFIVAITINVMCIALIGLSGKQRRYSFLFTLLLLNVLLVAYHATSWQLHQATELSQALALARMHSGLTLVALPLFMYTFGHWCRYPYTNHFVIFFLSAIAVLLVINFVAVNPLRYGEVTGLVNLQSPFGDTITMIQGRAGNVVPLFHLLVLLSVIFMFLFAMRLYRQKKNGLSVGLLVCLSMQLVSSYTGYKIDRLEWGFFYIGGAPLTILSLITALHISSTLRTTSRRLVEQKRKRIELETALSRLAKDVSVPGRSEFYESMMETLYDFSQADLILLGTVNQAGKQCVDTRVALNDGQLITNFSYSLTGSPSEQVITDKRTVWVDQVTAHFPNDRLSKDENIDAYIGVPLLDEAQCPIGVLSLMYRQAIGETSQLEAILKIFAARAAAEFLRDASDARLKQMAYVDYLSQLPNRVRLLEVINEIYFLCQKEQTNALLMLIDLDGFGEINRKYGYEIGDQVIRQLGNRLEHYASKEIFIARNSGDEFVILIKTVKGEATSLLDVHWSALKAIMTSRCDVGPRQIRVNCSMGAVIFPEQLSKGFDVIGAAEHALKQAKAQGRNQYSLFDPRMLATLVERRELQNALANALRKNDQLYLVFQPKVEGDGAVVGAEALLRWEHPTHGFISPAMFIPMAEESGLIHELGRWVISSVCEQLSHWQQAGLPTCRIAINVAASQFDESDFAEQLLSTVESNGLTAADIEIEITESGLLADADKCISILRQLRAAGVTVALDDFGTGFSSLSYLQELPLDVLKIDKSFVDNLSKRKSAELVKAIIVISKHMQLKTVAEGTETQAQVDILMQQGCDYFQGYLFSKPLPGKDFMAFLQRQPASTEAIARGVD